MGGNEEDLKKWWDNMHINDEYNKGDKKKEKWKKNEGVKDWYKKLNIFLNRWENDNFINKITQELTEEKIVKWTK